MACRWFMTGATVRQSNRQSMPRWPAYGLSFGLSAPPTGLAAGAGLRLHGYGSTARSRGSLCPFYRPAPPRALARSCGCKCTIEVGDDLGSARCFGLMDRRIARHELVLIPVFKVAISGSFDCQIFTIFTSRSMVNGFGCVKYHRKFRNKRLTTKQKIIH